ncbi:hypothetical protein [Lacisediminihabitans sp.]|uniref:hypothetical protein n=1 Tax=Lacisediminihabitans sp. TaxID=2787631 RepID=UPI00374D78D7
MSERGKKRVVVTDAGNAPWAGREDEARAPTRSLSPEQQLELVDRVKGLEAQLAQVAASRQLTPTEQLSAEQQLLELRRSLPWRVGRVVTIPVRVLQRAGRRLRRR